MYHAKYAPHMPIDRTKITPLKANPENSGSSAIGWLIPRVNVLKGEKHAATVAVPTETPNAIS